MKVRLNKKKERDRFGKVLTCASGERGFMVAMACTAGRHGLDSLEEMRPPLASFVLSILATIDYHSEMIINMWLTGLQQPWPSKGYNHGITA